VSEQCFDFLVASVRPDEPLFCEHGSGSEVAHRAHLPAAFRALVGMREGPRVPMLGELNGRA
jgi:hypothetical protein